MLGIPRLRLVIYGCLAVGIGLSVLLWPRHSDGGWDAYAHAIGAAHARKMAADAQALRQADSALAQRDGTVTHVVTKYRTLRDTLNLTDTVQVKVFVERADSVVRACTELQSACQLFHARADSVIADLTVDRDAWKFAAEKAKPSRLDRVKEWGIRLGLAYAGYKVGQAVR